MTGMATCDYDLFKRLECVVSCDEFAASLGLDTPDWQANARLYFDLAQDVFMACPDEERTAEMAVVAAAMQRALAGAPDRNALYTESFTLTPALAFA